MSRIKITVIRKADYPDLQAQYENPLTNPCDVSEGMVFYTDGFSKPEGLCDSAWLSIQPFAMALAHGAQDFYHGWMKDPHSAMVSCNDGFRPVSFLVESV